ncbi:hypothetical protein ACHAWT_002787 [Skeletonema menzelii]|mmetsp:Transcript_22268/g.36443  ORF Transcript_22268/g.36443 Transcript_22268/m.36443 type:complete len:482 (-) Transcript_22268:42-1487(-)|eukprot:scaffold813_cov148-Skeletonema_menzelii.AAC.7
MRRLFGFRSSARHPPEDGVNASSVADEDGSSASDDDSENNSYSSQSSQSSESGSGDDESSLASLESMTSVGSLQYLFQKVNRSYNAVRSRSINALKMPSPSRTKSNTYNENTIIRNNSSSVQAVPEESAVNHGVGDECKECEYEHGLVEGDHVIRWKLLGYLYPIQIHGIVLSAGPDIVTLVDFGLTSAKCYDKVGKFDEEAEIKVQKYNKKYSKTRRRMNVTTLAEEKEIKKWTKVRYGDEVEIKVHDKFKDGRNVDGRGANDSNPQGVEVEKKSVNEIQSSSSRWLCSSSRELSNKKQSPAKSVLKLPSSDPSKLVLARLRFLLECGEEVSEERGNAPALLPPHHLLYANSECIAVWVKTGHWSTLQGSVFLHSSTVGNAKQTATLAMYLSAQTATVPASGLWGWLGGTTTVSLFTAQPWVVPALIGGGMVYIGLPSMLLWKAKGRWSETEKKLNDEFWSAADNETIVALVQNWDLFRS